MTQSFMINDHTLKTKPVVLCILDGFGHREPLDDDNGVAVASHFQYMTTQYPCTYINASESFVGLPAHQMGNSEVGHMTIGLGRVLEQDLVRINASISRQEFKQQPGFQELLLQAKKFSNRCHVMGLFSSGGVHSHDSHFIHAVECLVEEGVHVIVHPILDGRDTSIKAALQEIETLSGILGPFVEAGTIGGRYFAMDRDKRWDRIQKAFDVFWKGQAAFFEPSDISPHSFASFKEVIEEAYQIHNTTDEFIVPTPIAGYQGVQEGDTFLMMNFRADRARQFMMALCSPLACAPFEPPLEFKKLSFIATLTNYTDALLPYVTPIFNKPPLDLGLGEVLSHHNYPQLRVAETEKYAHVTYFFNGGVEAPFPLEERILIPSPSVSTYDLAPEMSAREVADCVLSAIESQKYPLIVVNFANPDMVGHTGNKEAIRQAISCIDHILKELEASVLKHNTTLLVTADHGNVETMTDEKGAPHTAHTCNLVPFLVVNGPQPIVFRNSLKTLADIAPSILKLLSLKQPPQMTGSALFEGDF